MGSQVPEYAILSHAWGSPDEEVLLQDLKDPTSKRGYRKVRFCGEQARKDGLQYFWIDSCCIDKTSSAELSEAINSMFAWYRKAAMCYVYLSDVSACQRTAEQWQSDFAKSRWFRQGWTLQELLASHSIAFFSEDGVQLGDKSTLENQISQITGIPLRAVCGRRLYSFETTISWMKHRETTIREDFAYCLLGLLDVHIPLVYGEGVENACLRIIDEINRRRRVRNSTKSKAARFRI